ncbi:MAG: hypothetical protein SVN78_05570 [Deferribacterota bacterium]|nr:hypothetical protein [Deferribacterota bacterium]
MKLYNLEETIKLLEQKKILVLSGAKELLEKLPSGNCIAGSSYYFINDGKGIKTDDKIYVDDLTDVAKNFKINVYNKDTLKNIYKDAFGHGFSYILVPYEGAAHNELALNLPFYEDFATKPLYGFVTGVKWESLGVDKAIVLDGLQKHVSHDDAVVLHIELPEDRYAEIDIVDPFEPDPSVECKFEEIGYVIKDAYINDKLMNFASYLKDNKKDLRFPLICSDFGAKVNVSFAQIKSDSVIMISPVFKGATYNFAKPVSDYRSLFKGIKYKPALSCNCVLNYQHMGLEDSTIDNHVDGPTTFGEIAYRLLNQTIVNLYVKEY